MGIILKKHKNKINIKTTKTIKVALSQRIIPHYRVPVFKELASRERIELTVFYGKGFEKGSQVNSDAIIGFRAIKLMTIFLLFERGGMKHLRVWHPTLIFHLIKGNYDVVIVEPSTNIFNNIFTFVYCKIFRKKMIWYDAGSEPLEKRTRLRRLIEPIVKTIVNYADAFITYTSYADKSLIKYYGVGCDKIFRAQNTVDTSDYEKLIKNSETKVKEIKDYYGINGHKVCLYIGGLERRKKINLLISAADTVNKKGIPTKVVLVGDGPDKEWIYERMTEREKENTIFAGKHLNDVVYYILASDVVVLPSEGGLSVTQAFACGKPFIGSEEIEHGGIRDYVVDGYNGYLFKEDDLNQICDILFEIFTNESLYNELCDGARKTAKEITVINLVNGIDKAIKYSLTKK